MELIRGIATSPARQTIVAGVVTMARQLDVAVIAEGVETEAELTTLRAAGMQLFQGYLFANPAIGRLPAAWMPAGSFADLRSEDADGETSTRAA